MKVLLHKQKCCIQAFKYEEHKLHRKALAYPPLHKYTSKAYKYEVQVFKYESTNTRTSTSMKIPQRGANDLGKP